MRFTSVVLCIAAVSACPTETPPVTASPTSAAPAAQGSAATPQATNLAPLINEFRAANGKGRLNASALLNLAAERHAQDMVANGYFSHTGLHGSNMGSRARLAGCRWTSAAQSIDQGQTMPQDVMANWINSLPHRANLTGKFASFGAARAGNTWVLMFATGR
jgi:uncharacterized protein YkwD